MAGKTTSVLVVGSVALDTVSTPLGCREGVLGGSATYFSIACGFFAPVRLVAVVGEDFPGSALELLRGRKVDLEGLEVRPGKTFRWGGCYENDLNQAKTEFTDLNVFEDFHPKIPTAYRDSRFIFLANIDPVLQLEVLEQVQEPLLIAGDTMNLWIELKRDQLFEVIRRLGVLIINDAEARQLSGEKGLPRAARFLLENGVRMVVIKKGEHGAVLYTTEEVFALPALPIEKVVDPTGAGDSFAGGFMGFLARSEDFSIAGLRQAVVYGSVMASFAVEDFSLNRLTRLTDDDIEGRYRQFKDLTRF